MQFCIDGLSGTGLAGQAPFTAFWCPFMLLTAPSSFPLAFVAHFDLFQFRDVVQGCESGQGADTKTAQSVAYFLGVPLSLVRLQPTDSFINPNNMCTGGSITSEICVLGKRKTCPFALFISLCQCSGPGRVQHAEHAPRPSAQDNEQSHVAGAGQPVLQPWC